MNMFKRIALFLFLTLAVAASVVGQNTNSSTTTRPRTSNTNQTPRPTPRSTGAPKPGPSPQTRRPDKIPRTVTPPPAPGSAAVMAAFNALLDGIRHANVNAVTAVYWNSPRLVLFNNNGTVTKGWDQMRKNRESSYKDLKDVKLEVRDENVIMLGTDGAVVTCLWSQTQTYKDTPETATGRMTLVFRRSGKDWKAVHLHTSPDKPDASRVLPSESTPAPSPTPTPNN